MGRNFDPTLMQGFVNAVSTRDTTTSNFTAMSPAKQRQVQTQLQQSMYRNFTKLMKEQAKGYIDLIIPAFKIPPVNETFIGFCFDINSLLQRKNVTYDKMNYQMNTTAMNTGTSTSSKTNLTHDLAVNIVGYEVLMGKIGKTYIHHFVLDGSNYSVSELQSNSYFANDCSSKQLPNQLMMFPWAVLTPYHYTMYNDWYKPRLPDTMGLGSVFNIQTARLYIHYNNSQIKENLIDQKSGIRIYYNYEICPIINRCQVDGASRFGKAQLYQQQHYWMKLQTPETASELSFLASLRRRFNRTKPATSCVAQCIPFGLIETYKRQGYECGTCS